MILLNEKPILCTHFPDNTISTRISDESIHYHNVIEWKYESDTEMALLYYVVKHIRDLKGVEIVLNMPYIPNARMDRVKYADEIFTLKYFAEFINSLEFDEVRVIDPHSNVSAALLNNLVIKESKLKSYIEETIEKIGDENLTVYFPDEGSMKRYGEIVVMPHAFGIKRRDWRTGNIEGITLINEEAVKDKNVLIIDDICSKGGTFYYSAKALKAAGAKDIYLYVTHCENTIFKGELIDSDLIRHIFTTNSIFTLAHPKITVFKLDD